VRTHLGGKCWGRCGGFCLPKYMSVSMIAWANDFRYSKELLQSMPFLTAALSSSKQRVNHVRQALSWGMNEALTNFRCCFIHLIPG
jgi:hypothetical protein